MKYTLLVTQRCNLACRYCYIVKRDRCMSLDVAQHTVDFIFQTTPPDEPIDLGFFGGEPLFEFDLLRQITDIVIKHPRFDSERVDMNVVTNGTILTREIIDFLNCHNITYCLSCDGPPFVHDRMRRFPDGSGSARIVEENLKTALSAFPAVLVNAVYHPETIQHLAEVIDYFSLLGLQRIYLNPDVTAQWTQVDTNALPDYYGAVAQKYIEYYKRGQPHFISLIDGKIVTLLRGGYQANERCRMGIGEFAFTPDGGIYPCERLIGSGNMEHRIGTVFEGIDFGHCACRRTPEKNAQPECADCGLRSYCMYWCGCTNYLMTGHYDRVHPFLCASEQALLRISREVFRSLDADMGTFFADHAAGRPMINLTRRKQP